MKRALFLLVAMILSVLLFAACGNETAPENGTQDHEQTTTTPITTKNAETNNITEPTDVTAEPSEATIQKALLQFPPVSFEDSAVVYDGSKHAIQISSALPDDTTVTYTYNDEPADGAVNAGTYTIRATIKNDDYEIKRVSATLTIQPAQFPAVSFADQSVEYDGSAHSILVSSVLPAGTTVVYSYNDAVADSATEVGTYTVTATLKNANYVTKTLTATLRITQKDAPNNVTLSNALKELLNNYRSNLSDYLPEPMRAGYATNAINSATVPTDYSSFVFLSTVPQGGFGEQWHMILDNIAQSERFYVALNTIEGLSTSSIAAFDEYLDKNPSDTAFHQFKDGIYTVTITNDESNLYYVLDYTASYPLFGEQTIQIALTLDLETHEKTVRIQIGDANALSYRMTDNSYQFGIRYLGVRRAYFSLTRDVNGKVTGHINEFLEVAGKGVHSAADFYIEGDYVTAIGNKASGMVAFTGTICELYNKNTGKLLGYEVEETLSKITYNTLWFGFDQISGINSIKYREKTDTETAAFFVNGSTTEWVAKKVGGLSLKTASRRFDIEFRTQYFYTFDSEKNEYVEIAVEVPMFFVQEEQYSTVVKDVKDTNDVTISINLPDADLEKLQSDYDNLIESFKERKDTITSEQILDFIGTAKQFD